MSSSHKQTPDMRNGIDAGDSTRIFSLRVPEILLRTGLKGVARAFYSVLRRHDGHFYLVKAGLKATDMA
jgi:hypothetical protein